MPFFQLSESYCYETIAIFAFSLSVNWRCHQNLSMIMVFTNFSETFEFNVSTYQLILNEKQQPVKKQPVTSKQVTPCKLGAPKGLQKVTVNCIYMYIEFYNELFCQCVGISIGIKTLRDACVSA